jgi:UDP-glucose 4-epimerase
MSKNAIVLGGSGFIARSVINLLLSAGFSVENWDVNAPEEHKELWKKIDITSTENFNQMLSTQNADYLFHFAGVTEMSAAEKNEEHAYEVNVMATLRLVKELNLNPKAKLIYASSIYADGNSGGTYGRTKKAAEDIIKSYLGQYQILRFGSVYGLGARTTSGLVGLIAQVINSSEIAFPGDGTEIRNYIHVDDLAEISFQLLGNQERWNKVTLIQGFDQYDQKRLFSLLEEIIERPLKLTYLNPGQHNRYSISPLRLGEPPIVMRPSSSRDFASSILQIMQDLQKA